METLLLVNLPIEQRPDKKEVMCLILENRMYLPTYVFYYYLYNLIDLVLYIDKQRYLL